MSDRTGAGERRAERVSCGQGKEGCVTYLNLTGLQWSKEQSLENAAEEEGAEETKVGEDLEDGVNGGENTQRKGRTRTLRLLRER